MMESLLKNKVLIEIKDIKNVVFIESVGSFINANYLDEEVLWYDFSLNELENYLPTEKFFRISKTYIINADFIKRIKVKTSKRIILHNDLELDIDETKYESLIRFLKYKYII